jgi:hypothetical protein
MAEKTTPEKNLPRGLSNEARAVLAEIAEKRGRDDLREGPWSPDVFANDVMNEMARLSALRSAGNMAGLPPTLRAGIINRLAQEIYYDTAAFEAAARERGIDLATFTISTQARADIPPPPTAPAGSTWQAEGDEFDIDAMNDEFAFVLSGGAGMIVRMRKDASPENRLQFIKVEGFKLLLVNRFTMIRGADGKKKDVSWATAWLVHRDRRQYDGIEFYPDAANQGGTPGHLNLWQGFARGRSKSGSYAIFKDHLLTNVCHGDEALFAWLFAWFANIFQQPRNKPGTSIVLRGAMGVGKTKVGEVFGALLGPHYFPVGDPRYITGQFNHHLAACLLLQGEEAVWAGDKLAEGRLKDLVTGEFQMIEAKGVDPVRLRNFVRVIQTSNEDWVVPAGKDERRFAIFDVAPTCANDSSYFAKMDAELESGGYERLLDDLLTFDLSKVNLRQIPKTEALLEQKIHSLEPIGAWLLDRLKAGAPTTKLEHWPKVIALDAFREDYLKVSDEVGIKRKAHETQFGMKILKYLPSLKKVRRYVDEGNRPAMARSWCYELPPLDECRREFEHGLGQVIDWGERDDDQPVQPSVTDDIPGWTRNGEE